MLFLLLIPFFLAAPPAEVPKFHVSYGRMVIEGNEVVCHLRFFKDDLEEALRQHHRAEVLILDADARSDSLFLGYLAERFVLTQAGRPLEGAILQSGEEQAGPEVIWWYVIRYETPAPAETLHLSHNMLFEVFSDQKNVFKVLYLPSENTQSFYFVEGSAETDLVSDA